MTAPENTVSNIELRELNRKGRTMSANLKTDLTIHHELTIRPEVVLEAPPRVGSPLNSGKKALITIDNELSIPLEHKSHRLYWGKWEKKPKDAKEFATTQVFIAEGDSGSSSGCEGHVDFEPKGFKGAWFRIKFDCPISADNVCEVKDVSKDFKKLFSAEVTTKTPDAGSCVATITVKPLSS